MLQPPPIKVKCTHCGYSKLFAPKSDVVMPGQYNCQYCTRCGSTDIKVKTELSLLNQLWIKLFK